MASDSDAALRRKAIKNVLVISIGFFGLFGSSSGFGSIQTSINKQMAVTAGWVIYVSLVLSCAFLPTIMIKKLGEKWTMPLCMLCYTPYLMAQLYPRYYTLVPAALLMGLGAAPMWSAKCTYFTQMSNMYANLVGEKNSQAIISRFFGIFFFFFHLSIVVGNLVASMMLSTVAEKTTLSEKQDGVCGSDFCPAYFPNLTATKGEEKDNRDDVIAKMAYGFLASTFLFIIGMCIFVDPLPEAARDKEVSMPGVKENLIASFTQMKKVKQILIIPLTMWSGWEQNFDGADFPAAFVTCGLGVHMVGYIMICMGMFDSVFSIAFTPMVKKFGRVLVFTIAAVINIVLFAIMLLWKPNPHQVWIYFFIAAFWGIADAVWQTQINAFYGALFASTSEAAFANYRLWESLGFAFAYMTSRLLCVSTKIYILCGFLIFGMGGYYTIELMESREAKARHEQNELANITKVAIGNKS